MESSIEKNLSQMKRVSIAPDGSCLFSSIEYLMTGFDDVMQSQKLRRICIDVIKNDNYFTEDTLGENKSVEDYCTWLEQPLTYGGGNEISILSKYLKVNIVVISCIVNEPCVVMAVYSPEKNPKKYIHLLYTGQHYDAIIGVDNERIFMEDQSITSIELAKEIKLKREVELKTRMRAKLKCSCGTVCDTNESWKKHIEDIHIDDTDFDYLCESIDITEIVANINDE